jgi:hypothetical protein
MSDPVDTIMAAQLAELVGYWDDIRGGKGVAGLAPGKGFELVVLRAFQREGAEISLPFEVKEDGMVVEQIDGAIHSEHLACLVEAKDTAKTVDFDAIAKLAVRLSRRPPTALGVVFSRSGFTAPAKIAARYSHPRSVLLWSGIEFDLALRGERLMDGPRLKYQRAVEFGIPDFDLRAAP